MTSSIGPLRLPKYLPVWLLQLFVFGFLASRLVFDVMVNPMGDEAYYWMWGQHLDWSYFDHPPLHAWLQGVIASIFGWSNLSLRLLTWFSLAGSLAFVALLAKRFATENTRGAQWTSVAFYLSLPVIIIFTAPAFHDHLLSFFCVAGCYFFIVFMVSANGGAPQWRLFYLAATLVGLATLTKYNGAILGIAFAVVFVSVRHMRALLRTPHPWLGGLLSVAMQTPVIYWNLVHSAASLRFHFVERPGTHWGQADIGHAQNVLMFVALVLGPFVLIGLVRLVFVRGLSSDEAIARKFVLATFLSSTAIVVFVALYSPVLLHWNLVAYVALAIFGYRVMGWRWLLLPHLMLTLYLSGLATWNYSFAPVRSWLFSDPRTGANFDWPDIAEVVRTEMQAHPGSFVATADYTYSSQLGFQLHDAGIATFSALPSQYDLWWQKEAHRGQSAIILADRSAPIATSNDAFATVEKLKDIEIRRGNRVIWTFQLYLAEGYLLKNAD